MGGLYGSPRILQSIANDGVIPVIRSLSKGVTINYKMMIDCIIIRSLSKGVTINYKMMLDCIIIIRGVTNDKHSGKLSASKWRRD